MNGFLYKGDGKILKNWFVIKVFVIEVFISVWSIGADEVLCMRLILDCAVIILTRNLRIPSRIPWSIKTEYVTFSVLVIILTRNPRFHQSLILKTEYATYSVFYSSTWCAILDSWINTALLVYYEDIHDELIFFWLFRICFVLAGAVFLLVYIVQCTWRVTRWVGLVEEFL